MTDEERKAKDHRDMVAALVAPAAVAVAVNLSATAADGRMRGYKKYATEDLVAVIAYRIADAMERASKVTQDKVS